MGKVIALDRARENLIKDGIAHISYTAAGIEDIVHPFSEPGYELLSEGFVSFLEKLNVILPEKVPIVLEINGTAFNETEKKTIDAAVWSHFCLHLAESRKEWINCCKRMGFHLLYLILSFVLLVAAQGITDTVLVNLAYLPFWFFGYRFIGHLIMDCRPILKAFRRNQQLASLKLTFADDAEGNAEAKAEDLRNEIREYEKETLDAVRGNAFANEYFLDKGIVSLGCRVNSIDDVLSPNFDKDWSFLSDEMGAYLTQAAPFINRDASVRLLIGGTGFTEEEKDKIKSGIQRYFNFFIAGEEKEKEDNKERILCFGIFLVLTMILLSVFGKKLDVALHEFVIMLFWFFGDYLLEFLLLSPKLINEKKRVWEAFSNMQVEFDEFNESMASEKQSL